MPDIQPVNILLIRLRLIGDVVFTTPAIHAVRRRFPDARLAYLVEPLAEPVVRGSPQIDEVIVAPRQKGRGRLASDLALLGRLRAARYDLVIDFHGGPRSSLMAFATGAPMRIGYRATGRSWAYTHRIPRPRDLWPRHAVLNQWDLLAPLGIAAADPLADPTEMPHDPQAAARVEARLTKAGFHRGDRLIVIHVSAGNPFRRWPVDSFSELAGRLAAADPGLWVAITSGPSDLQAARRVGERARAAAGVDPGRRILCSEEFDLAELRAFVAGADLFIGGDSGPMHIASTTRTPIVALYGPTLPARSAPWRDPSLVHEPVELPDLACRPCDQRECIHGDFRCLAAIAVDAVLAAAGRALSR
jgi:heptosyltransferase-1